MRWSCGILIMHCFVHLHETFKVHCRRSWHFFPALPFHNLFGGVSHVSLSKLEIAVAIAKQRILQIIHIVVAIGQCLQVTVIILCKYIVSFHNSQQRRHVTVWHASQERALYTIYYCQISNIMC